MTDPDPPPLPPPPASSSPARTRTRRRLAVLIAFGAIVAVGVPAGVVFVLASAGNTDAPRAPVVVSPTAVRPSASPSAPPSDPATPSPGPATFSVLPGRAAGYPPGWRTIRSLDRRWEVVAPPGPDPEVVAEGRVRGLRSSATGVSIALYHFAWPASQITSVPAFLAQQADRIGKDMREVDRHVVRESGLLGLQITVTDGTTEFVHRLFYVDEHFFEVAASRDRQAPPSVRRTLGRYLDSFRVRGRNGGDAGVQPL